MIASWMLYAAAFALLLTLAALAAEHALLRCGLPMRWPWVVALLASGVLPPATIFGRAPSRSGEMRSGSAVVGEITQVFEAAAAPTPSSAWNFSSAPLQVLDRPLLAVWATASIILLLVILHSLQVLRRRRVGWKATTMAGTEILLSADTGPAVIGFRRFAIVLPRWAAELEPRQTRLMIQHEKEHIRAGDPYLLFLGIATLTIYPWCLPLWWQIRRLRGAVEVDCDRRVLNQTAEVRAYGSLLLSVASRKNRPELSTTAFAGQAYQLERRIRMMTASPKGPGWLMGSFAGALAILLTLAAFEMKAPAIAEARSLQTGPTSGTTLTASRTPGGDPTVAGGVNPTTGSIALAPLAPTASTAPLSPPAGAGAGDTILRSGYSPHPASESLPVLPVLPELPELPVLPVRRLPRSFPTARVLTPSAVRRPAPSTAVSAADTIPHFTPFEVRPQLLNRQEYGQGLEVGYPAELKDAGIGGTVIVWVFIDEGGIVRNTQVVTSSGYEELDRVAQDTLRGVARFSPAGNRGEPVPVWIQIPIMFQTR